MEGTVFSDPAPLIFGDKILTASPSPNYVTHSCLVRGGSPWCSFSRGASHALRTLPFEICSPVTITVNLMRDVSCDSDLVAAIGELAVLAPRVTRQSLALEIIY